VVIHGHFYQPPREDPWTGVVPEQPSAAPFHDWNERIAAECYGPVGEVPLDDGSTVNLYEHLSFNVGPTLLSWLEQHQPTIYERIQAADRRTGRAIAQAHSHSILPLCNDHDLHTQLHWGIRDFEHRFGRRPEGIWLPETAVSERVLRALVDHGLRFTILAPHQLDRVRPLGTTEWVEAGADGRAPAIDRAYRWHLRGEADRWIDLVVYDGPLAQSLAFGDPSAEAMVDAVVAHDGGRHGMVVAATDGETFGHHRKGAERQLARAVAVEAPDRGVAVPRLLDLLESMPPTHQATVRTSAWSCAHGIGRWVRDCGCHTGGEEGWTQEWREPLRNALDRFRDWGSEVMDRRGPALLSEQWRARDEYIDVQIGARSWDDFATEHVVGEPVLARALLEAQRFGLLMYTSCGWFFNDLAGIETVQILQYAARSMDWYRELGEVPEVEVFLDELGKARSNDPAAGDGRQVWRERVDGARPH
jgi:alpha-amylase/alpha-mannosidase (GH57 family)